MATKPRITGKRRTTNPLRKPPKTSFPQRVHRTSVTTRASKVKNYTRTR